MAEQMDSVVRWTKNVPWSERMAWVQPLTFDIGNLRAAWRWSLAGDPAHVQAGLRLTAALYAFFYISGYQSEACQWANALFARDRATPPSRARARALSVTAKLAAHHGDVATAQRLGEEYMALPGALHEFADTALVLNALSLAALARGDLAQARRQVSEATLLSRGSPESGSSLYLPYVAAIAEAEGNLAEAEQVYQEALRQGRTDDFVLTVGLALDGLARVARARGDRAQARSLYGEALQMLRQIGGMPQVALLLVSVGHLALEDGNVGEARAHFFESLDIAATQGHRGALLACLQGLTDVVRQASPSRRRGAASAERLREATEALRNDMLASHEAVAVARSVLAGNIGSELLHAEPGLRMLTPREQEVATLLARGYSNRQIADALVLGTRTVEMHVGNVLSKLGLSSRAQVPVWAIEHGVLDPSIP